jgi:uncharacterized Zn finger protein (UPF0148 family)
MAQVLPRYCPRCGAPIVTSAGTCATCGLHLEAMLSRDQHKPPEQAFHDSDHLQEIDQETTQHDLYVQREDPLDTVPTSQSGQQHNPPSETQSFKEQGEHDYLYLSAPKKRSISRRGFVFLLAALLFVLGAIAYIIAGFLGVPVPGFVVIQPPVTTIAINSSVPYAGVDVTVLNAQQSQSFVNDPNSSAYGMVRLNLREHNQSSVKVGWSYENIARLMLPDKSIVNPTYANAKVDIAPGAFQKSVVDFAVPTNDHISQLTLLLGATNEAQIVIPLTGNAEVGRYQPKTVNLNGQMQYFGLNWTLTSATSSLSINGQQATKGMRYVTVALKVDNTLSQVAITGSSYDFIRLKYGSVMALPKYTTLPVAFDGGAAGVTGTVSFLVPQNTRSYTLILEPQKEDSGDKASTDFQVT